MSVQEYLDKHMLSRKIEDAVNAAVRAKTPDPVLLIAIQPYEKSGSFGDHQGPRVGIVCNVYCYGFLVCSIVLPTDLRAVETGSHLSFAKLGKYGSGLLVDLTEVLVMIVLYVQYEAIELRDGDKGTYLGNGVNRAVRNINEKICEALIGMDPTLQAHVDQAMIDLDKTEKRNELGANAILAVSIAACKAGAAEKEASSLSTWRFSILSVPLYKHIADLSGKTNLNLPVPAFTLISGGKHAGNNLNIQEIMILPVGAKKFEEAVQMGSETYHHLKYECIEAYGLKTTKCCTGHLDSFMEGRSETDTFREGLNLVKEAIDRTGYKERIKIALDVAATDFCIGTKYDLDSKSPNKSGLNFKSVEDMIEMYKELCTDYPIVSIEDPFDKEDWDHVKYFSSLGICQVVGDDLLMSNPKRIERAIRETACNALLLKVNQVGTVTEAIEVVKMAKDAHWGVVVSQRSGETEDSFIADLSVGLATGQIKAGAPCRGERLAKYNQVLFLSTNISMLSSSFCYLMKIFFPGGGEGGLGACESKKLLY
ncbi:hypothetical protein RJ639_012626 [Escallonia herrerae]|uniref:phosphopyruvate hydratase n=1 Tax=Escallonia herrerae TaxID=1293975 RepID=A0AA88VL21_9ASTE|nr:hypothetical protein RJ639_012626 [Escallonia herrerae]